MRIIDVHTHPVFEGRYGSPAEVDRTIAYARSFGVERMVALGDVLRYGRLPTADQVRAINDRTIELLAHAPDFFIGFCFLNPLLGERFVREETERCVFGHGFMGLKLEISVNAVDPAMRPVMEQAEALDVVVLQHSADQTNIRERAFHSDPADTAQLARTYPNVRVIMAHLTACGIRGVREAAGIDNLWVDTSAYLPEAGIVEYAVETLGAERLLYGSDLPIRDVPAQLGRILGSRLSEAERERILFTNARDLLGLA